MNKGCSVFKVNELSNSDEDLFTSMNSSHTNHKILFLSLHIVKYAILPSMAYNEKPY